MRSSFPWAVFLIAAVLTGCVSASTTRLSGQSYPATSPDDVTIYLSEEDIDGEYEKVALINLAGNYQWTDQEKMFKKARKEAAKVGANGVLVQSVEEPSTGEKVANALIGVGGNRQGEMLAIYVIRTD